MIWKGKLAIVCIGNTMKWPVYNQHIKNFMLHIPTGHMLYGASIVWTRCLWSLKQQQQIICQLYIIWVWQLNTPIRYHWIIKKYRLSMSDMQPTLTCLQQSTVALAYFPRAELWCNNSIDCTYLSQLLLNHIRVKAKYFAAICTITSK